MKFHLKVLFDLTIAKDFIRRLLVVDPKLRLTAQQALEHPFITENWGSTPPYTRAIINRPVKESRALYDTARYPESAQPFNKLAPMKKTMKDVVFAKPFEPSKKPVVSQIGRIASWFRRSTDKVAERKKDSVETSHWR